MNINGYLMTVMCDGVVMRTCPAASCMDEAGVRKKTGHVTLVTLTQ